MPLCGPWAVDRPNVRAHAAGWHSRTMRCSLRQTLGLRRLGVARHTVRREPGLPKRTGVRTLDLAEILALSWRRAGYVRPLYMYLRDLYIRYSGEVVLWVAVDLTLLVRISQEPSIFPAGRREFELPGRAFELHPFGACFGSPAPGLTRGVRIPLSLSPGEF